MTKMKRNEKRKEMFCNSNSLGGKLITETKGKSRRQLISTDTVADM